LTILIHGLEVKGKHTKGARLFPVCERHFMQLADESP
jgi:hypothetical protein